MSNVATSQKSERRQSLEEMLVVDVDVHLHEKPAEMAKYIDGPFRQSLEIANRPEAKNAINPETHQRLWEIWQDFRDDAWVHLQ